MDFKLIGSPCGQHGPYTFYKAFKYSKHGKTNILALSEFFFVKLWNDSDLVSIGELQLLWEDKNSEQTLASLRLYILPENTPEGRSDCHGEHEVLAITEKVVLRLEDLLTWITEAADWSWGLSAVYDQRARLMPRPDSTFDLADVDKEKDLLDSSHWETRSGVVVLSFPRYCRYRGVLKRLEGVQNQWLREALVVALGGFTVPCRNTRVLYCKETFDYPDLEGHELLCNHLAPKLKGRPRKKRKLDRSPDSSDSESESSSISTSSSSTKVKLASPQKSLSLVRSSSLIQGSRRVARFPSCSTVEKDFLSRLFNYMRSRQTPISRVPTIGFKELDLYKLFTKVCHLGGYDAVTSSRLWKYVYEEMGGDQSSTSAATCCRRHYERLLLPYERHLAPNRSKNATLAKLKRFQDISITSKPTSSYGKSRILPIKNGNLKSTGSDTRPPREKENIPQSRSFSSEIIYLDSDTSPNKDKNDVIDLVSESDDSQSPNKMKALPSSLSPKKQKLEILKEGGLEVTPVSKGTNGRPPVHDKPRLTDKPRPSVIQQAKNPSEHQGKSRPSKEKVSITITPDVSHMLPNNRHAWSLGGHSVYGNPKDVVQPRARTNTEEILDLTTKSPFAPVGSNLEITLVPPSSSATQIRGKKPQSVQTTARSNTQKQYQSPQQRLVPKPVLRVPSPVTSISNGRGSGIVPNVSISVNPAAAPLDKRRSSGGNSYPVMDPVYLSAFYSGLFTPPQLQMYKELLHRHNVPDSFPRLLQDGSTSISLVDRSHSRSNPSK